MDADYKKKNAQYKIDIEKWKAKYNVQDEDLKR